MIELPHIEVYDQRATRYIFRERCHEMLSTLYWREKPYTKCKHTATHKVNGKPLCNLHAGRFALEFVVANQPKEEIEVQSNDHQWQQHTHEHKWGRSGGVLPIRKP